VNESEAHRDFFITGYKAR